MATDNDWADGSELAGMGRQGNVLEQMGYDPDEARTNPEMRQQIMSRVASPAALPPSQRAAALPTQVAAAVRQAPPTQPAQPAAQPSPLPSTLSKPTLVPRAAGTGAGTGVGTPGADPAIPTVMPGSPAPGSAAAGSANAVARGAGMPTVTPTTSAQTSPNGKTSDQAAPDSRYGDVAFEALNRAMAAGGRADQAATDLSASTGPDTDALEAQRTKDAAQTPYFDTKTGKVLDTAKAAGYKPGLGTEILRGVRGAVVGGLTGGIPGALVGAIEPQDIRGGTAYGAPDKAYQATEAARTGRLASEDQQIENAGAKFKAMTDARKAAASENRAGVTAYNDVAKQGGELMKAAQTGGNLELHDTEQGPLTINRQTGAAQRVTMDGQPVGPKLNLKESQPIMGADNKPHTYMLDDKGNKVVDLGVHYEKPININTGAGGGGAMPGNPNTQGNAYLKTLPPSLANTVRAIGEYREPPPSAANRSKQAQMLLSAVNQAYPEYKGDVWPTLQANRKAFTSAGVGQTINSFNTALKHLDELDNVIPDNSKYSTVNSLENALSASGSDRGQSLARFNAVKTALSGEIAKAYKGGSPAEPEIVNLLNQLSPNASPAALRATAQEFKTLLNGKLDSFRRQYESGLPAGSVIPLETIGINGRDTRAGGGQGAPGAAGGGAGGGDNWFSQHPVAK